MKKVSKGLSLIEVLVSLIVLSVGVLGMAALQVNSLKFNQTASMRTHANFLAYDIADRMRANRSKARAGSYDITMDAAAPSGSAMERVDLREWKDKLASQLPDGKGAVSRDGKKAIITIVWDESRVGGSSTEQFVYETQL
ncbi:type IV pilus modification protein PilV [Stutzerimonas tarimensis]|uniref:Type IV pilus modification protein PilV n=1 Tax=Stutzerimonas tarimensis TaxID=1507735 RepID=A0ABV7T6G2_9GAMM